MFPPADALVRASSQSLMLLQHAQHTQPAACLPAGQETSAHIAGLCASHPPHNCCADSRRPPHRPTACLPAHPAISSRCLHPPTCPSLCWHSPTDLAARLLLCSWIPAAACGEQSGTPPEPISCSQPACTTALQCWLWTPLLARLCNTPQASRQQQQRRNRRWQRRRRRRPGGKAGVLEALVATAAAAVVAAHAGVLKQSTKQAWKQSSPNSSPSSSSRRGG